jgi:hypothetical protein
LSVVSLYIFAWPSKHYTISWNKLIDPKYTWSRRLISITGFPPSRERHESSPTSFALGPQGSNALPGTIGPTVEWCKSKLSSLIFRREQTSALPSTKIQAAGLPGGPFLFIYLLI